MSAKNWPDHYRYGSYLTPEGVELSCSRFVVVGETPRCYYVISEHESDCSETYIKNHRRRVLKDSHKRFCYPNREEALKSFIERQRWRERHAREALSCATLSSRIAADLLSKGSAPVETVTCGQDEYTIGLRWIEY